MHLHSSSLLHNSPLSPSSPPCGALAIQFPLRPSSSFGVGHCDGVPGRGKPGRGSLLPCRHASSLTRGPRQGRPGLKNTTCIKGLWAGAAEGRWKQSVARGVWGSGILPSHRPWPPRTTSYSSPPPRRRLASSRSPSPDKEPLVIARAGGLEGRGSSGGDGRAARPCTWAAQRVGRKRFKVEISARGWAWSTSPCRV